MKLKFVVVFSMTSTVLFGQALTFEEYNPKSTLVVKETLLVRAKYPFVDAHNHQWAMPTQNLKGLIDEMDKLNMAVMVNLSGKGQNSFTHLKESIDNIKANASNRIIVFTNLSFSGIDDAEWSKQACDMLEQEVKLGANGLKIYKELGLFYKDKLGKLIAVNDKRLDPIWKKCAELKIPVFIHSAAPASFWQPFDKNNERWLELKEFPDRRYDPAEFPSWEKIISDQHDIFKKNPRTTFINAHLGWMGNDLLRLGSLLDACPNVYTEIGAVIAEIGRQPNTGREFFIKYQDRILFGKDTWQPQEYLVYFRILETNDEYFDYYRRRHAFWKMYGMKLPDEVLMKIYFKNAIKIIPGIDESLFRAYIDKK